MELYIEQIFFALVFTIIISIVVVTIHVKGDKKGQRRPPQPAGALPLIGHLHLLGANQLLHRTFGDMADKYGPVFSIRLGSHQALLVSDSKVAKECFTTNDKVLCTRPKSLALELMGYNNKIFGFGPYGQYWRDMRKLVTVELLSSRRLELLKHVRDTEINCFIKELYEQTVKNRGVAVVEMKERISNLAMNIIVRMIAGKAYFGPQGSCDEESRRCQKAMGDFMYMVGLILVSDTVPLLGWVDVLMGRISKMKRTAKDLDVVLGSWVNEHRDRKLGQGLNGDQDFIDVMLSVMDEGNVPTQEANTIIKANCLLHRDPSIWQNPLHFLPERFLTDHANVDVRGKHFELIPFSSGRRTCPGVSLTLQVAHLALARLLHAFELGTVSDTAIDMSESPGLSLPRATPLEVTLTPRLPSTLYG
ncbi:Cytochrome P450 [Corchorus olitorius]|uniref:Cytochrome P450 n=1 Tax=Corchorus olitorius TaxID=93759 RepID=A0A1R3JBK5_9ROSI|nr:Cytochrome P450 [Corchorus olitorius]